MISSSDASRSGHRTCSRAGPVPSPLRDAARSTSRVRAHLTVQGWQVLLSDDSSANGTLVSPERGGRSWLPVTPRGPLALQHGDRVRLGERLLLFDALAGDGRPAGPRLRRPPWTRVRRIGDYVFLRELGRGEHSHVYLARAPRRLGLAADTVAVKLLSLRNRRLRRPGRRAEPLRLARLPASPDVRRRHGRRGGVLRDAPRAAGVTGRTGRDLTRRERLQAVARAARARTRCTRPAARTEASRPRTSCWARPAPSWVSRPSRHLLTRGHTLGGLGTGCAPTGWNWSTRNSRAGARRGPASDIWSLGATLHQVLTGHGLFPALVSADPFTAVRIYLRSRRNPARTCRTASGRSSSRPCTRTLRAATAPRGTSPRPSRSWPGDRGRHRGNERRCSGSERRPGPLA